MAKICWDCDKELDISNFGKNIRKKDGIDTICGVCKNAREAVYRSLNKEKIYARQTAYWHLTKNTEKSRIRSRKKCKVYQAKNKDKFNYYAASRRALKLNATPQWANLFFIEEIYHLRKVRSEKTGFEWHVDHIVPLNSKVVCGLHNEFNLQLIPAQENRAKSNKFWPDMQINLGVL